MVEIWELHACQFLRFEWTMKRTLSEWLYDWLIDWLIVSNRWCVLYCKSFNLLGLCSNMSVFYRIHSSDSELLSIHTGTTLSLQDIVIRSLAMFRRPNKRRYYVITTAIEFGADSWTVSIASFPLPSSISIQFSRLNRTHTIGTFEFSRQGAEGLAFKNRPLFYHVWSLEEQIFFVEF